MKTSDDKINCAICEHFSCSIMMSLANSCQHPDRDKALRNQVSLCEDFKDFNEQKLHESKSDNAYYYELVNNSVGKNCPL